MITGSTNNISTDFFTRSHKKDSHTYPNFSNSSIDKEVAL